MSQNNSSKAIKILDAKNTNNKYYLFPDKLLIGNSNGKIIKTIYPPSDSKAFARHMLVKFEQMYYENEYLAIVVSTRLWQCWFKLLEDKLELSEDYHRWM
ncbi:MAG: hypothetical protein J6M05_06075 [Cardiobacteriaceae bacterium]|nr:hypothetical protein [Cardiobacteriaceae bacterium]